MRRLRENKGITLIALVITIIVILIIASITLSETYNEIDNANENRQITELEKIQHAIVQRDTKYKLINDSSILVGTKIELSSLKNVPSSIKWQVDQSEASSDPEKEYYRLDTSNLNELGLTKGSEEYEEDTYIVNYYSGEVYNETQKTTKKGKVLYKTILEND